MRKQPKRKPRAACLQGATRIGYCPVCRISTTQRITIAGGSGGAGWRTATCEPCGSEIERTSIPRLTAAGDVHSPGRGRIVDAQLAESLAVPEDGRTGSPLDRAGEHESAKKKVSAPKGKRSQ